MLARTAPLLVALALAACSSSAPSSPPPRAPAHAGSAHTRRAAPPKAVATTTRLRGQGKPFETGYASWYGAALAGHHTASGEIFDPARLTAAHRTLKLGTWVEVRRRDNGRSVRVKVNDRGPVSHRFIIDLSHGAAVKLGMVRMGVAPVELRLVSGP